MENIFEKELNALIEQNNKLIETKQKCLNDINEKLQIGKIIEDTYIIADNYRLDRDDDGKIIVKVLVHPNFRIHERTIDDSGIPYIDYGCACDMIKFPLDYLPNIKTCTIEEVYAANKDKFIDNYIVKLAGTENEIARINREIYKIEKDIKEFKKIKSNLEYTKERRDDLIDDLKENYSDKAKAFIEKHPIQFLSNNMYERAWKRLEKLNKCAYIKEIGFEK